MQVNLHFSKKLDFLVLLFINAFAVTVSLYIEASFLFSTVLFLVLPSLYLCLREEKQLEKIFLASLSFGVLFGFCFDFIAELNNAWNWSGGLWFGKILGVVQVDVMFWFFFWVFHIIIFYEHFLDRSKLRSLVSKRGKKSFAIGALSVFLLVLTYFYYPEALIIPKAYLVICLVGLLPFTLILLYKPKTIEHVSLIIPYFFLVYLSHEITALKLLQWNFPGDYIGWIHMLGVSFPVEEMFFWIILSSLVGAVYYEVVFDNSRT